MLVTDSTVLVAGGGFDNISPIGSMELFDPLSGNWTNNGSLLAARQEHTAGLLPDGRVLLAGGESMNAADLYEPSNHASRATAPMHYGRYQHTDPKATNNHRFYNVKLN
jgi:hypothetical protein